VGDGAVTEQSQQFQAIEAPSASWQAERERTPGSVRVGATVASDAVALVASALAAAALAVTLERVPVFERLYAVFPASATGHALLFVALIPYWLFMLYAFGLYREPGRSIGGSGMATGLDGLTALTVGSWFALVVLIAAMGPEAPVAGLIVFWMLAIVVTPGLRWTSKALFWWRPAFAERTVIVGAGSVGNLLAQKIAKHPEFRVRLLGFIDDGKPVRSGGPTFPVIGSLDDLGQVIEQKKVSRVIVAFSRARHPEILNVVRTCAEYGVKVNIVPRLFEVVSSRAGVDDVEGIPLLDIGPVELGRFNVLVKRVFDLIFGSLLLLVASPILVATAIAIKIDSRGPVFFRQERMGRRGAPFRILKFRSMTAGAEKLRHELDDQNEYSGPMFKIRADPRITRTGSFIRRWSIDELPQLFNVMTGDMSLVGPRPLWVEEARQCRGWTRKRLEITPGITGLWQVLGRSSIPFDEMVKLDYVYVTGWSLSWDIKLLLETVPAVLAKRGAY
jgi:exopolysaccharide biosynthesis polyprenyl glycosylphosphotransferase